MLISNPHLSWHGVVRTKYPFFPNKILLFIVISFGKCNRNHNNLFQIYFLITAILCFRKYVTAVDFSLFWDIQSIRYNLWIVRTWWPFNWQDSDVDSVFNSLVFFCLCRKPQRMEHKRLNVHFILVDGSKLFSVPQNISSLISFMLLLQVITAVTLKQYEVSLWRHLELSRVIRMPLSSHFDLTGTRSNSLRFFRWVTERKY